MDSINAGTVFQERYEILSRLGEGGFGQVYRARQRVTQHEVAVKVLRALHTGEETHVARFQREMQLCAGLHHPNIVRLIDSGRVEPDLLYTVFEYVPGRTLGEVLAAEGALAPAEAAHLMLQVLDALGCAHKRGIIHRDLKPQNIMITDTGVRRNALVLDFGLGTFTPGGQQDVTPITRTREVLGTPAYAAPEQLRGEPVAEGSDLYSWGLIFLECLTGQRVVEGATLQQVLYKQIGPEPVALPAWLEDHRLGRLLRKVTHKDARLRESNAQNVLRELESCASEGWPAGAGRSSAAVPVTQPLADTLVSRIEGERRQLTALCCGLRLETRPEAPIDEEDLDRLLWSLHTACAEIARRHDAHVGSLLGERVLFYFGYPKAQEDDARRAARAALELSAEMERRGAVLARERKGRLECQVGLHTGLVISQEPRARGLGQLPALVGATPSLAVRLAEQAEPGTVLLSETCSRLLRGYFAFEPVARPEQDAAAGGALRLLHEYRALGTLQPESLVAKPLYGRTQELRLLQQRWWQAAAGTGQSIVLTGEPGIGKSRLVQELARQVRGTPHTVLESRCVPEGRNSALHPVVDLLERLLGVSRGWTPEQTVSALEALLSRYGFELSEAMPLFLGLLSVKGGADRYPPLNVAPQRAKELTFDALVGLFFELARQQPLLLLVEDVHWADPTTLELLEQLIADVATERVCLLVTARPEFSAPWTASHHLQLNRLDRKGVEEMVSELTRGKPLPSEVVEQLVQRTDGVPLFVEELTHAVVGALPSRSDTPSRLAAPGPLTIPSTLRDSLMARLDRLGPAKEVAQLASALGREFSYEVLKALSQRDEAELQGELKALVEADLVHRRRGVRNPTYLFRHALIRDTAYESMLKEVRRQVHARVASTLEAHFPEIAELRPELLAQHHAAAEQKRQALGYAQKATLGALMRSANHEAVAYATEALSWLEVVEDPRERAQLELGLNSLLIPALMVIRGWSDALIKERVDHSQQLIDFLGDSPQTVPNLWALMVFHHTRGHREQARALVERLMAMAEQAGAEDLKLMVLCARGHCLFAEGQLVESRRSFERAAALYEPARHAPLAVPFGMDARAWADMCLGLLKWMMGEADPADAHVQASLAWSEEIKNPSSLGLAYLHRLSVLQGRGEREQLITQADAGLEVVRRHGLTTQTAYCQMLRSWATRDADSLRKALDFQDSIGLDMGKTYYKSLLADVELDLGRHEAALEILQELIRWGRATGEHYAMAELLRLRGRALRARGDAQGAEASLHEALGVARGQSARTLELKAASALAELLLERGQPARAREQLAPVLQAFGAASGFPDMAHARALLEKIG